MLFSFLIIEYHFKDWLANQHANTEFYNHLAFYLSSLNTVLMVLGIAWCYYQHKKNNGTNFWQRFAALNSSIGFHVLLYSTAILFIAISVLYVIIHIKIETFKGTIVPTESTADFLNRLFTSPFGAKSVTAPQQSKGILNCVLGLPCSLLSLPFIPGKIAAFLQELRTYIMQFYPILAALPTVLLITQYYLVQRWFTYINSPLLPAVTKSMPPANLNKPARKKTAVKKSVSKRTAAPKKTTAPKKAPTTKK